MLLLLLACAPHPVAPTVPAPVAPRTVERPWVAVFDTTAGTFLVEVHPDWAPLGAARFRELIDQHVWDGARFYRVLPGFAAQWGLAADPAVSKHWQALPIQDDPPGAPNRRGTVALAATGEPNSRSLQAFVNLADNPTLDALGFRPFGEVIQGMDVVERFYSGYGEALGGAGHPDQLTALDQGEPYFAASFPRLDQILTVKAAPL